MEGRPWGGLGILWCPTAWGGVGQLLPAALSPCCHPVPAPQQKHQKKKSLWANQDRFFFLPMMK